MKTFKLIIFLGSIFAISAGFFACGGGETPPVASISPSLTFISPDKSSQQYDRYDIIQFHFTAGWNLNTKKGLSSVKMVATYTQGGTTETLLDSTGLAANTSSVEIQKNYTVSGTAPYGQIITITVTAEDANQQKATKVFLFTVTNLSDLNYYNVTMGAQSNVTLGSYFASDSGKVLLKGDAKNNQSRVDFIYFFNDILNDGNCIAAPSSTILADNTDLVATWNISTRNATQLKLVPIADPADYDKIRSSDAIKQLFNAGGTFTYYIPTITDGGGGTSISYIAFKTTHSKFGIIKVSDIVLGTGGFQTKNTVTLDVRVQK